MKIFQGILQQTDRQRRPVKHRSVSGSRLLQRWAGWQPQTQASSFGSLIRRRRITRPALPAPVRLSRLSRQISQRFPILSRKIAGSRTEQQIDLSELVFTGYRSGEMPVDEASFEFNQFTGSGPEAPLPSMAELRQRLAERPVSTPAVPAAPAQRPTTSARPKRLVSRRIYSQVEELSAQTRHYPINTEENLTSPDQARPPESIVIQSSDRSVSLPAQLARSSKPAKPERESLTASGQERPPEPAAARPSGQPSPLRVQPARSSEPVKSKRRSAASPVQRETMPIGPEPADLRQEPAAGTAIGPVEFVPEQAISPSGPQSIEPVMSQTTGQQKEPVEDQRPAAVSNLAPQLQKEAETVSEPQPGRIKIPVSPAQPTEETVSPPPSSAGAATADSALDPPQPPEPEPLRRQIQRQNEQASAVTVQSEPDHKLEDNPPVAELTPEPQTPVQRQDSSEPPVEQQAGESGLAVAPIQPPSRPLQPIEDKAELKRVTVTRPPSLGQRLTAISPVQRKPSLRPPRREQPQSSPLRPVPGAIHPDRLPDQATSSVSVHTLNHSEDTAGIVQREESEKTPAKSRVPVFTPAPALKTATGPTWPGVQNLARTFDQPLAGRESSSLPLVNRSAGPVPVQRQVAPAAEAAITGPPAPPANSGEDSNEPPGESAPDTGPDLDRLARQIYPLIKRRLAIERQQQPRW